MDEEVRDKERGRARGSRRKKVKSYNSMYSVVVTYPTIDLPSI